MDVHIAKAPGTVSVFRSKRSTRPLFSVRVGPEDSASLDLNKVRVYALSKEWTIAHAADYIPPTLPASEFISVEE